jgi:CO/xanthine dehydrogenase Mo-binding subunit
VTVVAPAVANAIYNAVGARVRALPITAEAVKAAMKA